MYKIINRAANLWILGLKTEKVGTIIRTEGSGRTELLGGYIYSVSTQNDIYEAAFETVNATSSLYWVYANTGGGSYFPYLLNETQGAVMRSIVNPNPSGIFVLSMQASISYGPNWHTGPSGLCSNCDWLGGSAPPEGTCQYDFLSNPDPSLAQPGGGGGGVTLLPTSTTSGAYTSPPTSTDSGTASLAGAGTTSGVLTSSSSKKPRGLSSGAIAGIVVGVVIASALVALLTALLLRRHRNQESSRRHSSGRVRDKPIADM